MGKVKDMNRRAKALRLKEKRLKRQSSLLSVGNDLLQAAEQVGFEKGFVQGLRVARDFSSNTPAKQHKNLLHEKLTEAIEQAHDLGRITVGG